MHNYQQYILKVRQTNRIMVQDNNHSEISDFLDFLSENVLNLNDSLTMEFNNNGFNVTHQRISEITGIEVNKIINIRDALAYIVYYYKSDRQSFEKEFNSLAMDEHKAKNLRTIFNSLDSKGLEGLELLYEMMMNTESPLILGLDHQLLLTSFLKNNKRYYMPQVQRL